MNTKQSPRYYVHTVTSATGIGARTPHWVIDRTTGLMVDEFTSKKAAAMTATSMNTEADDLTPDQDCNSLNVAYDPRQWETREVFGRVYKRATNDGGFDYYIDGELVADECTQSDTCACTERSSFVPDLFR